MEPPSSSQSPPPPPSRGSLFLCNLPPEIISMIVDKIAEEYSASYEEFSPLRAIAAVNREFAALAEPYLWRHVDLRIYPRRHLTYILASVLPKHASHVTHLDLPLFEYDFIQKKEFDSHRELYESEVVVLRGELEEPRDAHQGVLFDSHSELRESEDELLAQVIGGLPQLSMVSCSLSELRDAFSRPIGDTEPEGSPWTGRDMSPRARESSVAGALLALGPRLHGLALTCECDDYHDDEDSPIEYTQDRLASFLMNFPSLNHLSLVLSISEEGCHALISTISSWRHLKTLVIWFSELLDDAFAAAAWTYPLTTLKLAEVTLRLPTIVTLLANFTATLTTLILFGLPYNETSSGAPLLFSLPHLHTLDIFLHDDITGHLLLSAFALCPLQYITINENRYMRQIKYHDLLQAHVGTLKRVLVCEERGAMHPSRNHLRQLCEEGGIECIVVDDDPRTGRYKGSR